MTPDPRVAHGLLGAATARGAASAAVGDRAWLTALLDTEAALARASATVGLIPTEHADAIAAACRADRFAPASVVRPTGGSQMEPHECEFARDDVDASWIRRRPM